MSRSLEFCDRRGNDLVQLRAGLIRGLDDLVDVARFQMVRIARVGYNTHAQDFHSHVDTDDHFRNC